MNMHAATRTAVMILGITGIIICTQTNNYLLLLNSAAAFTLALKDIVEEDLNNGETI